MKPLFTEEEFQKAKASQPLALECERCGKTFYRQKTSVECESNNKIRNRLRFCSVVCNSNNQKTKVIKICEHCGNSFQKILSQIQKSKHHFCCQSCAAKYHNSHRTMGYRRSKLEIWLESQLTSRYPNYVFHFNKTDAINAELDIYIPHLKLAFELNGIFHYEPIYGQNKLNKMQTNDHRKMLACAERGIELCVIDTTSMLVFKSPKAQKYLDIIVKIINEASIRDCNVLTMFGCQ